MVLKPGIMVLDKDMKVPICFAKKLMGDYRLG
jgi:hypothetical protein